MDNLRQMRQAAIALSEAFDQRLERTILPLVPELDTGRVEGNRVGWKVLRGSKDKLRVRIDEPLDQPRRSDPVHMGAGTRDPAPPLEGVHWEICCGSVGLPGMQSHLDSLLQPLRFVVAGRVKEVDLPDALQLPCEPSQLLVAPRRAANRGLSIESTRQLPISLHEGSIILVPSLLEEPDHLGSLHVLD